MAYTVTPLRLEQHRDALARLWAENMSDARIAAVAPRRIRWLYEEGPAPRATTVLCLDAGSGEIVGCGSFFHRVTSVDGRSVRSGVLCDFAVTRAHRVAGVAVAIQRGLQEAAAAGGVELLYGHPNEKSIAVFRRVGYHVVAEATAWAKPLRVRHRLADVLGSPGAAALASAPVDAALSVFDRLRSAGGPLRLRGELLSRADARVDELWERARHQYGVVGEQSSSYLGWRYGRFPTAEHGIVGAFGPEDGRLVGFAVFTASGRKAVVCDVFAEHLEACLEPLMLHLSRHLRAQGAESVSLSYVGPPAVGTQLMSVGFLPRPGKRPLVLYPVGLDPSLRARVLDPSRWFMLEGELDI